MYADGDRLPPSLVLALFNTSHLWSKRRRIPRDPSDLDSSHVSPVIRFTVR